MNPTHRRLRFSYACLLLASFTAIASLGCDQVMQRRAMPAPVREPVETTFSGKITKLWSGDNFEYLSGKETHYLILRGVDAPNPGEPFFYDARNNIQKLAKFRQTTVHVFDRDEMMREIAEVTVPVSNQKGEFDSDEFDLGTEMIKQGWARYNGDSFDGAERLIKMEASAKQRKVGIWAEPKPKKKLKQKSKKKPKQKADDKK